jgi:hypothetical protein
VALSPASSVRGGFPLGLPGATAATRYVGATATGAPASGTFAVGDFAVAQDGSLYICTAAGSPGTWTAVSGGGGAPTPAGVLRFPAITAWQAGNSPQAATDVVYVAFYVDSPCDVTDVIIHHQSAVGNVKVGIYSDDAGPDVLLASSGSLAAATVHPLTASVELQAGRYFAAMLGDNGGRRVYWSNMVVASSATEPQWFSETVAAFTLPDPAAAAVVANGVVYDLFAASFP